LDGRAKFTGGAKAKFGKALQEATTKTSMIFDDTFLRKWGLMLHWDNVTLAKVSQSIGSDAALAGGWMSYV
jgi:hypothetical protein